MKIACFIIPSVKHNQSARYVHAKLYVRVRCALFDMMNPLWPPLHLRQGARSAGDSGRCVMAHWCAASICCGSAQAAAATHRSESEPLYAVI